MRTLTKDIEINLDGKPVTFRLSKPDAFTGVRLLRFLVKVESQTKNPTVMDLIGNLTEDELKSVMTAVLNHISVLLPAGPNPVMTGNDWTYAEIRYDTPTCMRLLMEGLS